MLKRRLYIILALLMVFTTTASIWEQLLSDSQDSIEISFEYETDAEKGEKESKKEVDSWDDDFAAEETSIIPDLFSGFQKVGSSTFAPTSDESKKLYILFQRLKLDC